MSRNQCLTVKEKYLLTVAVVLFILAFVLMGCVGPTGDLGRQGIPGHAPIVTTLPAPLSECLNGGLEVYIDQAETIICNGVNGSIGATGPQGPTGASGQDSTPITMVKFCPNITAQYSSSFPEWGIKIGTQIWAVYSQNGGFLTLLVPGRYTTTGVGSNCNFTVNNDGTLSY